jgi:hypothetical protein
MARPVGVWRRGGRGFEGVGFGVGVMGGVVEGDCGHCFWTFYRWWLCGGVVVFLQVLMGGVQRRDSVGMELGVLNLDCADALCDC